MTIDRIANYSAQREIAELRRKLAATELERDALKIIAEGWLALCAEAGAALKDDR